MKLVNRFVCALLVTSAAARAQSAPEAPYKSASGSKTVGFVGDHASATATFAGELGGGAQTVKVGKAGTAKKLVAHGGARASADVSVFGKKLRVAGLDAGARSEFAADTRIASASAWAELTVCNYSLRKEGQVNLPTTRKELIVFKATATFTLFAIPIKVKGEFGGGMEYGLSAGAYRVGDPVKKGAAPMGIGVNGFAAVYALLRVKVEASAGIGGVGVGGDGQLLRTSLEIGLGATSNSAKGTLKLVVIPLRLRIYVYAWIDLPGFPRKEARKYIADLSMGGNTYNLFTLS